MLSIYGGLGVGRRRRVVVDASEYDIWATSTGLTGKRCSCHHLEADIMFRKVGLGPCLLTQLPMIGRQILTVDPQASTTLGLTH